MLDMDEDDNTDVEWKNCEMMENDDDSDSDSAIEAENVLRDS